MATKPLIGNTAPELAKRMRALGMSGLAEAVEFMDANCREFDGWDWTDRLAWLTGAQEDRRFSNRVGKCHKEAKLRYPAASVANLVETEARELDVDRIDYLASENGWIDKNNNVILLGLSGSGKTFIASALGASACDSGRSVRYIRTDDLIRELADARLSRSYEKVLNRYTKPKLLILDEFLLTRLQETQTVDLLSLIDKRSDKGSLILCTQYPVSEWPTRLCTTPDNAPLCEAILDRIVHGAHFIELKGKVSMRDPAMQRQIRIQTQKTAKTNETKEKDI